jgi:hypothetical protein
MQTMSQFCANRVPASVRAPWSIQLAVTSIALSQLLSKPSLQTSGAGGLAALTRTVGAPILLVMQDERVLQ